MPPNPFSLALQCCSDWVHALGRTLLQNKQEVPAGASPYARPDYSARFDMVKYLGFQVDMYEKGLALTPSYWRATASVAAPLMWIVYVVAAVAFGWLIYRTVVYTIKEIRAPPPPKLEPSHFMVYAIKPETNNFLLPQPPPRAKRSQTSIVLSWLLLLGNALIGACAIVTYYAGSQAAASIGSVHLGAAIDFYRLSINVVGTLVSIAGNNAADALGYGSVSTWKDAAAQITLANATDKFVQAVTTSVTSAQASQVTLHALFNGANSLSIAFVTIIMSVSVLVAALAQCRSRGAVVFGLFFSFASFLVCSGVTAYVMTYWLFWQDTCWEARTFVDTYETKGVEAACAGGNVTAVFPCPGPEAREEYYAAGMAGTNKLIEQANSILYSVDAGTGPITGGTGVISAFFCPRYGTSANNDYSGYCPLNLDPSANPNYALSLNQQCYFQNTPMWSTMVCQDVPVTAFVEGITVESVTDYSSMECTAGTYAGGTVSDPTDVAQCKAAGFIATNEYYEFDVKMTQAKGMIQGLDDTEAGSVTRAFNYYTMIKTIDNQICYPINRDMYLWWVSLLVITAMSLLLTITYFLGLTHIQRITMRVEDQLHSLKLVYGQKPPVPLQYITGDGESDEDEPTRY